MNAALVWSIAAVTIAGILFRAKDWPEAVWACLGAGLLVLAGALTPLAAGQAAGKGTDVYLFLAGMMLLSELARREGVFDAMAVVLTPAVYAAIKEARTEALPHLLSGARRASGDLRRQPDKQMCINDIAIPDFSSSSLKTFERTRRADIFFRPSRTIDVRREIPSSDQRPRMWWACTSVLLKMPRCSVWMKNRTSRCWRERRDGCDCRTEKR